MSANDSRFSYLRNQVRRALAAYPGVQVCEGRRPPNDRTAILFRCGGSTFSYEGESRGTQVGEMAVLVYVPIVKPTNDVIDAEAGRVMSKLESVVQSYACADRYEDEREMAWVRWMNVEMITPSIEKDDTAGDVVATVIVCFTTSPKQLRR